MNQVLARKLVRISLLILVVLGALWYASAVYTDRQIEALDHKLKTLGFEAHALPSSLEPGVTSPALNDLGEFLTQPELIREAALIRRKAQAKEYQATPIDLEKFASLHQAYLDANNPEDTKSLVQVRFRPSLRIVDLFCNLVERELRAGREAEALKALEQFSGHIDRLEGIEKTSLGAFLLVHHVDELVQLLAQNLALSKDPHALLAAAKFDPNYSYVHGMCNEVVPEEAFGSFNIDSDAHGRILNLLNRPFIKVDVRRYKEIRVATAEILALPKAEGLEAMNRLGAGVKPTFRFGPESVGILMATESIQSMFRHEIRISSYPALLTALSDLVLWQRAHPQTPFAHQEWGSRAPNIPGFTLSAKIAVEDGKSYFWSPLWQLEGYSAARQKLWFRLQGE